MNAQIFLLYYKVHIGTWLLLLIVFGILFLLYKWKIPFANRILRTTIWLLYLAQILSGAAILYTYKFQAQYIIKGIISLILIYAMEVILRKTKRNRSGTSAYWFIWFTALSIVLLLGFNVGINN
ncbi:DUF1516 family protein [Alkalicoccobacillus plakortidis]|uniref:DUF1516 family protein n=1 Tax=Alkalicoccobacillus plakortidis TaxID=444060 RepID=A0ABT0XGW1_9BACI|nr:DUF1516 family protein [Alkalicoccobacillus plakortidis]MCM2675131.1 DUF1516 family protein [Alkalicoccobacillus plakortidis]